ncbi:MAG: cation-transporting P-type ATPase [Candidatus Hadarchaeia archaeon]
MTEGKGITQREAEKKLEEYGPNEIREEGGTTLLDILERQIKNILVIILVVAAFISFFTSELVEFYFIVSIIFLIIAMGAVQEWKSEEAMSSFRMITLTLWLPPSKTGGEFTIILKSLLHIWSPGTLLRLQ